MDACALCGIDAPLRKSHIVPRFAVKWLTESSATGHMRGPNINLRTQDLPRKELLCDQCEQVFSAAEREFAASIFHPYVERQKDTFEYEEWLLKMSVSLAWRCLSVDRDCWEELPSEQLRAIQKARRHFAGYLLGDRATPGPYSHHLLFLGDVEFMENDPPKKTRQYLLRGCDSTIVLVDSNVIAYTKLPMMLFATYIVPYNGRGWHRTEIRMADSIGSRQSLDNPFSGFLARRPQEVMGDAEMSSRQSDLIERDLLRNPERVLSSRSFDYLND